jgi:hypothetical protein
MQYTFACPLEGCSQVMKVEAMDDDQALDMLIDTAKGHLSSAHPELHKSDEEIRADIQPNMQKEA